ncbi:hypothetical protein GOP47_0026252 [Adiantum capillus-veneris]|nr:hypothetical protein GOP47_0026252 [Adiantum capillus-veneris]
MSWQDFVDGQLMVELAPGKHLSAAAIMGQDGNIWAQSHAFPAVTSDEIESIAKGFNDSDELAQHGVILGGTKYMLIQGEPGQVIRGKKGKGGVTIKKTSAALVIGIYDEGIQPSECSIVVEKLGDYLIDQCI